MWPRRGKSDRMRAEQVVEPQSGELMPPEIHSPQGCQGYGAIVAEPWTLGSKNVLARFGCPGLNRGHSEEVYENSGVHNEGVTQVYLQQVKRASEAAIGALCLTCPLNPLNRAPDDAHELDRPPYDV